MVTKLSGLGANFFDFCKAFFEKSERNATIPNIITAVTYHGIGKNEKSLLTVSDTEKELMQNIFFSILKATETFFALKNTHVIETKKKVPNLHMRFDLSRCFSAKHYISENSVQNIRRADNPQRLRIIGSKVLFYL